MIVKPVPTPSFETQRCRNGNFDYSVARLAMLAADLEVMDIPLAHMDLYWQSNVMTLREMAGHVQAVNDADMSKPIIMNADGEILDGRHRIMRALVEGRETIKAVRFEDDPRPCEVMNDG